MKDTKMMRMKSCSFFLYLFFLIATSVAQSPTCPGNQIYIHSGATINQQAISPVGSPASLVMNGLPPGSGGLAVGPAFGFVAPNPTFWTTSGGTFWYFNGTTWTNTTHSTGNLAAVNLGGGGNRIYNLVGGNGSVYAYDGTGTASLVATITGFGGPYDIVADDNDNFYLLRTTTSGGQQKMLAIYDSGGNFLCSYSVTSVSSSNTGGGFGIVNGAVFDANSAGLAAPIVPGNTSITFTAQSIGVGASDWANCSLPVPTGTILSPQGGTLDCGTTSISLIAEIIPGGVGMSPGPPSSTLTSTNYTWSGPGILSGQNTATITVNQAGVYGYTVFSSGCPPQRVVKSFTVLGMPYAPVIPMPPSCLNGTMVLTVSPASNTNIINWMGPGLAGPNGQPTMVVNAAGNYSALVTNTLLNCAGLATVTVLQPPNVAIALSSPSICAQNTNNSPVSLTLTPLGASFYTLITSPNYSTTLLGPWIGFPVGVPQSTLAMASATVIGSNGTCANTATASFSIIPNPTISITPPVSSVCLGSSATFTASGASSYSWLGTGLNTLSGSVVTASVAVSSIYSAYGSAQGCNSATESNTLNILPIPTVLVNTPSPTICLGNTVTLTASGTAATFTWLPMSHASSTVALSPLNITTYTVIGSLNTCTNTSTATVNIVQPPAISMGLSSLSVCAQGLNGSPNSLTITPLGAQNYTLLAGPDFMTPTPFSTSFMPVFPTGAPQPGVTAATATLLGSNNYCTVSTTQTFYIVPNPVIAVTPPIASICPGQSQLFVASGATSYTWSVNGSGMSGTSGPGIVVTPTVTSVYSAIGSSNGCNSGIQSGILAMLQIPTISLTASSPTVCSGSSVMLSASGDAGSYTWSPGGNLSSVSGISVIASPLANQSYTVLGSNTCTNTAVISISVIPSPTVSASSNQYTVCEGSAVHLTASGANSYSWGPVTGANSTSGAFIIATPGQNTTFTAWGSNGICIGSASVFVETVPSPNIQISASANMICSGNSVTIQAEGAQNLVWSPSAGLSSNTGSSVIASPLVSTNYTISGSNANGSVSCSQLVSYLVLVSPRAEAKTSVNAAICAGGKAGISASGGDKYIWSPAEGLSKTNVPNVMANPSVTTIYTVDVSYNGYCGTSNTVMVTVYPNPVANAGRDTTFNLDEPMFLSATGSGTLTWLSGSGILCKDCPETQIQPAINDCYVVEATNVYGCKATDQVCVSLTDLYNIYIPNSFTPFNKDGLNDIFQVYGTGILEMSMSIYDRWGERLFSTENQLVGWDGTFKGANCNLGVYVYSITYKGLDNKVHSKTGHVTITR